MRTVRLLAVAALSTIGVASFTAADTVIPVGTFQAVEVRNGGHVLVRHGQVQRVAILTGDARCTRVHVAGDETLAIEKLHGCGRNRVQIEVITPRLEAVSVSNGGSLKVDDGFPAVTSIDASVEQGGTLDIRSIRADDVHATVRQGGRILTHPQRTLMAAVESGGNITYWGDPRVRKSIRAGGVVQRGTQAR